MDEQHQMTRQAVSVSDDGTITGTQNLLKPKSKLDLRKNFFTCRVVNNWNNLPADVKEAGSVDDFKIQYDLHMAGK